MWAAYQEVEVGYSSELFNQIQREKGNQAVLGRFKPWIRSLFYLTF